MNMTKRRDSTWRRWAALPLAALLAASGCDDSPSPTEPTPNPNPNPVPAVVATVTVTPPTLTLQVGDTARLTAVLRSAQGDTLQRTVTWSSTDTTRAAVTAAGVVTARATGTVTVRASSEGRTGETAVTVEAPPPPPPPTPSITLLTPATVAAGGPPLTLRIFGTDFQPDARVQWNGGARPTQWIGTTEVRAALSAEDVASVGTAQVQVVNPESGKVSTPAAFAIVPQENPVAAVAVHPALAFTRVGAGVLLTAGVEDSAGRPLDDRYITWESSNQLVATVDASGLVRPLGAGEVIITARSEGMSATSIIRVSSDEFHNIFASDGVGLTVTDLRQGTPPVRFWENWPGSRALEPSLSPSGQWIAYTIESTIASDSGTVSVGRMVAVLNLLNMTYQPIPDTGLADQPAWSPAGDRIAFRAKVGERTHIFTVRPDGTGLVNLTADLPAESSAQDPAWSPDGSRIVFAVQSNPGFWGLMIMNADGSGKRNLTSGAVDIQPVWLGDVVVFVRRDPQGTATDIWRISVSGVGPFMPLTSSGTAHSPTLSPDHGWIAYVEGADQGAGTLMAMRPFGEDARPLYAPAPGASGVLTPAWVVRR